MGRNIPRVTLQHPADMFVKPVDGQDDLFAFRFGFNLDGKALGDEPQPVVTEAENGDLLIEGYAAVFDGVDRQGENFAEGAFQRGIKSFLGGNNALCYHHKPDHVIGEVLDLEEIEGKGLHMRARVDHQPESSPLRWIYNAIKKGSMKGLSVGGFFKRKLTEAGYRIADMDFSEISVTGVPVHPGTSFAVVAGKALEVEEPPDDDTITLSAEDEAGITEALTRLNGVLTALAPSTEPAASPNGDE